ncbi:hypothetical protein C8Q76DRAFT_183297 [Earliella scabrosa]|nr:hypothetical protein C8Q76DRAFT_183297 [Earliella scabrosa]
MASGRSFPFVTITYLGCTSIFLTLCMRGRLLTTRSSAYFAGATGAHQFSCDCRTRHTKSQCLARSAHETMPLLYSRPRSETINPRYAPTPASEGTDAASGIQNSFSRMRDGLRISTSICTSSRSPARGSNPLQRLCAAPRPDPIREYRGNLEQPSIAATRHAADLVARYRLLCAAHLNLKERHCPHVRTRYLTQTARPRAAPRRIVAAGDSEARIRCIRTADYPAQEARDLHLGRSLRRTSPAACERPSLVLYWGRQRPGTLHLPTCCGDRWSSEDGGPWTRWSRMTFSSELLIDGGKERGYRRVSAAAR